MLRNEELFDKLNSHIKQQMHKRLLIYKCYIELQEKYGIPNGIVTDYITLRVPIDSASDFILYALASYYLKKKDIEEYFSPQEIKTYSKTKFESKQLQFPLVFDMVQIKSNQWIGKITVKQLMQFREAQVINYNEQTQRTMERKILHGNEYYQISINDLAVKEIENSYEQDAYIPNTLTFNIPEEADPDFEYDSEKHQLIIHSLKYFDILDGYHRYRALCKVFTKNPDFDYEMELRIVNFSEEHARHFIWQEDQKTKMSKTDSESYNQNDFSVFMCERIATGLPNGILSRNKGIIDFPEFATAIRYAYNTNTLKRSEAIKLTEEIKEKLNKMIDENPESIDTKWPRSQIYCAVCVLKNKSQGYYGTIQKLYAETKGGIYKNDFWKGYWNKRKATALEEVLKEIEKKGRR